MMDATVKRLRFSWSLWQASLMFKPWLSSRSTTVAPISLWKTVIWHTVYLSLMEITRHLQTHSWKKGWNATYIQVFLLDNYLWTPSWTYDPPWNTNSSHPCFITWKPRLWGFRGIRMHTSSYFEDSISFESRTPAVMASRLLIIDHRNAGMKREYNKQIGEQLSYCTLRINIFLFFKCHSRIFNHLLKWDERQKQKEKQK